MPVLDARDPTSTDHFESVKAAPLEGWLRIEWGAEGWESGSNLMQSLLSLLTDDWPLTSLEDSEDGVRDDLEPLDVFRRCQRRTVTRSELEDTRGKLCWSFDRSAETVFTIHYQFGAESRWSDTRWLQSSPEIPSQIPILALPPLTFDGGSYFCHALVGLASACGPVTKASWYGGDESGPVLAEWNFGGAGDYRLSNREDKSLWVAEPEEADSSGKTEGNPLVFRDSREPSDLTKPTSDFLAGLEAEWGKEKKDWEKISQIAAQAHETPLPLSVGPLDFTHIPEFRTPLQEDRILILAPQEDRVEILVEEDLPPDLAAFAIAHATAHVALGHVRPGDDYGHWDTLETLKDHHRRWDREVSDAFPDWFGVKGIESVNDLDARDKALLGVWRMIHETLGESSKLHPRAEKYQQAAYQRQAAERLLAQLTQYSGAMLCDGVGLGKTYIATTLMVHCANIWREKGEKQAADPASTDIDLFRITVLAPNSVVSTWHREAIPPLYAHGVLPASVRVISHSKLSRISSTSQVLKPASPKALSDLEHLILSDLVIVDEAHNFRSSDARRSLVLRDLLRLQPRKDANRRVLLLTATPVNNSLDDLRQQAALLFSKPIPLSDAATSDGYRRQTLEEIKRRAKKSRTPSADKGNVAALMVHGNGDASFSKRLEFRDDLNFGTRVQRIGDYLNEQDNKLREHQDRIRNRALDGGGDEETPPSGVRVADELLDRIVVQRSRDLCKAIEKEAGSDTEILFRPDASAPEKLHYSDEYDGISDVLAGFLPLFARTNDFLDTPATPESGILPLSLKIYMWYDVREGFKEPAEYSPVVGLQRALVLKRLESSPVSLLLTLLRLTAFHSFRLQQLAHLCEDCGDPEKSRQLRSDVDGVLSAHPIEDLDKVRSLVTGGSAQDPLDRFIETLAKSHQTLRPSADTDDNSVQQLTLNLYGDDELGEEEQLQREQVDRLWGLKDALLQDFHTLLEVAPALADIVFGKFNRSEWPRKFIAGGLDVDWPTSPEWGRRIVSDAKIRRLVARLLEARRSGQKTIVFSQFSDSLAYIRSVLQACRDFDRRDLSLVVPGLGVPDLHAAELESLLNVTDVITGQTEDRDASVNAFAPYYRIGPHPPATEGVSETEADSLLEEWKSAWRHALKHPIDVLLATDILAEGVNLQDAALLINFDIHWNPVRMIQRSGRIDRRLNPRIEHLTGMPEVEELAEELAVEIPRYYWHGRTKEAPLTVNMILPDELEKELLLRERIAIKTLAIDFTLGLDQGTGAEADWMASYKYQGISSLNAFDKDRAIEQIAGYHEKLGHEFARRGIDRNWSHKLNVWIRQSDRGPGEALIARTHLGQKSSTIDPRLFTRYLEPTMRDDGTPCWLWTEEKPRPDSLLNHWLVLDSEKFPPFVEKGIPITETSSLPLSAEHLLTAVRSLHDGAITVTELPLQEVARSLQQGITAVSAGFFDDDDSRRQIKLESFFILQLGSFRDPTLLTP